MSTSEILSVIGIIATLTAGFMGGKVILNSRKINKKNNKEINQSEGGNQIGMMDSSNNTVNIGDTNESKKEK
ncbi:hypothetical protein ACFVSZ_28335 [Priestia megaterium]|uniref:hypothetical protein n=1 Tax=Priestia megaterium TaxID=1404 RepID=UPI0036D81E0E